MGIIDNFKDVLRVAESVNNLDLYKKLAELQNSVLALQDENQSLKNQLKKSEEAQNIAARLRVEQNSYFLENDGPFCTRCWDVDKILVREQIGSYGIVSCPECALRRPKR